jgi:hypothetical protein
MLRPLSAVCLRYDCPHGKYEQTIVRERPGFDDDAFEGVFLLDLPDVECLFRDQCYRFTSQWNVFRVGCPHKRCFQTTRPRIFGHWAFIS